MFLWSEILVCQLRNSLCGKNLFKGHLLFSFSPHRDLYGGAAPLGLPFFPMCWQPLSSISKRLLSSHAPFQTSHHGHLSLPLHGYLPNI